VKEFFAEVAKMTEPAPLPADKKGYRVTTPVDQLSFGADGKTLKFQFGPTEAGAPAIPTEAEAKTALEKRAAALAKKLLDRDVKVTAERAT
jgi:hypothetical protein